MNGSFTDQQVATLRAVCDTVVPALERPEDPHGFWARRATETGADEAVLQAIALMPPEQQAGLAELLDVLEMQGFAHLSQLSREQVFTNMSLASRDAAMGVGALVGLTLFFAYSIPP